MLQTPKSGRYSSNNKEEEFRDDINERVSNMKLSLPNQSRAQHYFDMSLIQNNPQYLATNYNSNPEKDTSPDVYYTRKDNRDGMNNRMDSLMFQSFNNPEIPQSIRVNEQYPEQYNRNNRNNYDYNNDYHNHHQPNSQSTLNPYLNQQSNHHTNRKANKDTNNERMQNFCSLPKSLNNPMLTPPTFMTPMDSFRTSYNDQYKDYSSASKLPNYQVDNSNHDNVFNQYHQNSNTNPIFNNLPKTNESSRVNYKDANNERMQSLLPLPKTASLPTTTSDYKISVQQNSSLITQGRNATQQNYDNRQQARNQPGNHMSAEWERMANNVQQFGHSKPFVFDNIRPIDTRNID
jgi:hypothetical protein